MRQAICGPKGWAFQAVVPLQCQIAVFLLVFVGGMASLSTETALARDKGTEPSVPNIVFILADDLGWADVGCQGSTFYETPNIDRLAARGTRFTNAYAACQVCSPTRASILTGKYPARLNLTNYLVGKRQKQGSPVLTAPYEHHMKLSEVTLAEALGGAGYKSAHVGKWHLGGEPYYPQHQGFEVNIAGTSAGMPRSFFYPQWKANVPLAGVKDDYLPDRLTDEAIDFIQANRTRPFFLYLAYYAVHIPIQGKPALVEKYKAKEPGETQDNPHYAAMVEAVDQNVGRVLETLDRLELAENTVVVFFSDNGGLSTPEGPHTPATNNAPLREGKGHIYEGGIREPLLVRWPGKIGSGTTSGTPVASIDFYPTFLEMAGAKQPAVHTVDGVSLLPLLTGTGQLPQRELYWHYPHFSNQGGMPAGAVRDGAWKLIEFYEHGDLELYNLTEDIAETNNLAEALPERTEMLHRKLVTWRKAVDATMPPQNPDYVEAKSSRRK